MKNLLIATAAAAALSYLPIGASAASTDELAEIREQLQGLMQRVDKLEQENTELKTENENLQAQDDYLKAETRGLRKESAIHAMEVEKVKGADWAGRVAVKGDLRYRHEQIREDNVTPAPADRYRDRIRARVAVEARATDNILVGIGLATTEGSDPRSSNQSLDGVFSRKSFDLDLAYFDWKFAWGNLIGGKMKPPFYRPGQSLFFDGDLNPEGLAVNYSRGMWFGTAYNYWIDEVSGAETTQTADAMVHGLQIGARLPAGAGSLALGAHYYDLSAAQGRRGVFFGCSSTSDSCANGNTVIGPAGSGILAFDYQVIEVFADYTTAFGVLPFQLWADVAENQDPDDLNLAWGAGVLFGKAGNYRTWELGAAYQSVEKDALFAQFIDSDFAGGTSDSNGWVVRGAYAPVRNWTLNATYFINERNVDVGTPSDYDRLQLDFNLKF